MPNPLFFFKSPGFLIAKGKFDEARQVVKAMLGSDVEIPSSYLEKSAPASNGAKVDLFKGENLQKVIFPCALGMFGTWRIWNRHLSPDPYYEPRHSRI